jgi:20S proteasome alpha/beta subunit
MTVALSLVCSDGVLVASDSMASNGPIATASIKVHRFDALPIVWTASGSVYVIEEAEAALKSHEANLGLASNLSFADASQLNQLRSGLVGVTTSVMRQCYSSALPFGIQQQINGQHHPFITDFLMTGFADGTPMLLEVAQDGQANWHTAEGFYAIGSGGAFASVAQALMKHYLDDGPLPLELGMQIAYRTIETACDVSTGGVRTPVQMAVVDAEGSRIVDSGEIEELKDRVTGWKQVERDALRGHVNDTPASELEAPPSL